MKTEQHNILLILTDQHSPHVAGFAGNPHAHTGNLDHLAETSTTFGAATCQSPLCVPSRISLLTGKYTHDCSAWNNGALLDDHHLTLPQHLSANGHTTCCVGKMHLAGPRWMGGFDFRPYGDLRVTRFPFHQPDPTKTWDGRWNKHDVGRFPWAGETDIPESLLVDEVVTREALAFLREHADQWPEKPWFMTVGYSRPHFPLTAPGRYIRRALADSIPLPPRPAGFPHRLHPHDRFIVDDFNLASFSEQERSHALAAYYACVDYVDDCIGELIHGLKRDGLLEDTCIVYTSDHGDLTEEHGLWWKRSYYEAAAGVPLLISGPGLDQNRQCTIPVELVDLFPTFCELAGAPVPDGLPGESLVPLCRGQESSRVKQTARCDYLDTHPQKAFRMVRTEKWKYIEFPDAPAILFDLENNPGETENLLASGQPEACNEVLNHLQSEMHKQPGWDKAAAAQSKDYERWKEYRKSGLTAPAQYQLRDGRIEDADRFLYDGLRAEIAEQTPAGDAPKAAPEE